MYIGIVGVYLVMFFSFVYLSLFVINYRKLCFAGARLLIRSSFVTFVIVVCIKNLKVHYPVGIIKKMKALDLFLFYNSL